jgi:hypothetical protein
MNQLNEPNKPNKLKEPKRLNRLTGSIPPRRDSTGKPANLLNGETAMKSSTTVEEKALKKSMIGASHLQLLGL